MSVSVKSIQDELMVFGLDFEDEVPDKLVELCSVHRLDGENIVNEWMAFSATRHLEQLTVSNLNLLEHESDIDGSMMIWGCFAASGPGQLTIIDGTMNSELYQKILKENVRPSVCDLKLKCTWVMQQDNDPKHNIKGVVKVLNKRNVKRPSVKKDKHCGSRDFNSIQELIEVETEEENLLDAYSTPAKGSQKRNLSTPENPQSKRISSINRSPHLLFSPSSFSPSATPSQKYSSRGNRGEVVTSYGEVQGTSWSGGSGRNTFVKCIALQEESLIKPYKYMFQKLNDIRDVVNSKIEELGEALKNHYHIEEFTSVSFPAQETVTVLGQIACDSNGKLNSKSVILEGDREYSSGMYVPVDLSDLKEYSLFPGQVVVMEGTNSSGRKFVASKLYEGVPLQFYQATEDLEECQPQMIITACGPFTTSDTIAYDALKDLVDVINRDRPDVCILLGPFLDAKHEQVETLQLTGAFEEVFKSCLKMIIEGTRLSGSHLVFVPSVRDVHHDPIYPQPPFSCYETAKEDKQRVHFVADPCTISVNGVAIGFTSTDLLFHMGAEEISSGTAGAPDRFSRILRQILNQRSYYPLYPPNEEINIDFEAMYTFAMMPVTPDVFIVPSELRFFIKDISGSICMNPGRLTKGLVGGTYGRILVKRENTEPRRCPCISAQVVKI